MLETILYGLEFLHRALSIVERWCDKEGLTVNLRKTVMVMLTEYRKLQIQRISTFLTKQVQIVREFNYLQ